MTLSVRITLAMVAVVILTGLTAAGLSYRGLEQRLVREGLAFLQEEARRIARDIEAGTELGAAELGVLAEAAVIQDLRDNPDEGYRRVLAGQFLSAELRAKPGFARLRLVSPATGREIIAVERDARGVIQTMRDRDLDEGEQAALLGVAATRGRLALATVAPAAAAAGIARGRLTLLATGGGNAQDGIVIADLDLGTMLAGRAADPAVSVVSMRGELLHPLALVAAPDWDVARVVTALRGADRVAFTVRVASGVREAVGVATASIAGGYRIAVVTTRPVASFLADANSMLRSTLLAAAIAAVVAVGLSILLARSIIEPLSRMTAAVAPGADRRAINLPIEAPGEVGVLARAFQLSLDQERLFSAVAENVGEAIMTVNDRSEIETANSAATQMYGYGDGELIGLPLNALSGELPGRQPGDLIAAHALRPSPRPGEDGAQETLGRRKDGSLFPLEMIVSHTVVNGRLFFIAATRDITQRKRAEAERQESERRFATMFQTSPALVTITNLDDGRVYEVNKSWLAAFGLERDAVVGHSIEELGIGLNFDDRRQLRNALAMSGSVRDLEVRLHLRDAKALVLLMSAEVVQIDGRARVITTSIDVTEYRKKEDQLRQAHRMDAVGQLAGGIAHDFNNLLTVILGTSESMRELLPARSQRLREMTDVVINAADRGADLTRRLLAFSRRQTLDPEVIDPSDAIRSSEIILRRTMGEDVAIRLSVSPTVSRVHVDRGQLESALLNLAVNARDAMPHGGTLTIEADDSMVDAANAAQCGGLKPGAYVRIAVSDTGTGMPPEVAARAFEPFFTTKGPGKGTGLGLSMVYGFVTQSGGTVRIFSEPGHGARVTMFLPMASPALAGGDTKPAEDSVSAAAGQITASGLTARVLVVEDEPNVRDLVLMQLTALGYTANAVEDAASALAAIRLAAYDVLLTDVILPGGMNGRELADVMAESHPELRVMFTSGYSQQAIEIQGMLMPGATLLHKPFRKVELGRKMREVAEGEPYARFRKATAVTTNERSSSLAAAAD